MHVSPPTFIGLCKELTVDFISIEIGYAIWATLLYALIQVLLVTVQKYIVLSHVEVFIQDFEP